LQHNEAALADFQRALKLDPEYARAYHWRGRLWFSLDAYSEALDDFLQGLNLASDAEELELTADIAMDLGYLWFGLEDYQGALESFSLADSLGHPEAAEAINSIRQGRR
jgi:tetratricopeptide (TPR) repeat protein